MDWNSPQALTVARSAHVINNFSLYGIAISTADNAVVRSYVGTNAAGSASGTVQMVDGIVVGGANNTIGGTSAAAGNVVSGNASVGIDLEGGSATDNLIAGNLIGLNAEGTAAVPNGPSGVLVNAASNNTIGGTTASARNVISGNADDGIDLFSAATGNVVVGDYIGTDITGEVAVPNLNNGVRLAGSPANTIGGTAAGAGNVITGSRNAGVEIRLGSTNTVVQGNLIGVDAAGVTALAVANIGVDVHDANVLVGGTTSAARNVIADDTDYGVFVAGATSTGVVIEGNYIGTNAAGSAAIGSAIGVGITNAPGVVIGGSVAGAGNLISGNTTGVDISGAGSTGTLVEGNEIGTDATGDFALGNVLVDIKIDTGAANNTIGGSVAGARNLISGSNATDSVGVQITGSGSSNNVIAGNWIGLSSGGGALGNYFGVFINSGATNNSIGGLTSLTGTGAGNVISANVTGICINDATTTGTNIEGNLVGTDQTGTSSLGTQQDGIYVGGPSTTIGGSTVAARNVISGNTINGIEEWGGNESIQGNFIGTDITGASAVGNFNDIDLNGSNNTIGGLTSTPGTGPGNVISGSTYYSIVSGGSGNIVEGNLIGTDATGSFAIPNFIGMRFGGTNNVIGGSASGARNVISAAGLVGIQFDGTGVEGNLIQGNYIGTDITGTVALPNQNGVVFTSGATNNTVGGVAAGEGNIIAANLEIGVEISNSSDNVVLGNEIGVDGAGAALGNGIDGVGIIGPATGNTIGGTTAAAHNVISGQSGANAFGVYISGADATGNSVLGNYIGSDVSGSAALPNTTGIGIANSSGNTVGGTIAGAGNVVSGNGDYGVRLTGSAAIDNLVAGNYIGTNAAGTAAIPNASDGVLIDSGAAGNTIGGTTAAASNVISGNTTDGVEISGTGTSGNVVDGNFVGTDLTGTFAIANATGVEIDSGASANTIGGTAAGVLNVISGNTVAGARSPAQERPPTSWLAISSAPTSPAR